MMKLNIKEAEINLSKLLERVVNGEEVIIAKDRKPIAILFPYKKTTKKRIPGLFKGQIVIHPDFDEPLPEFDI
jgi:prevent-host-death family protein